MFLWKVSRNKRKGTIKKKALLSVLGLYFVGGKSRWEMEDKRLGRLQKARKAGLGSNILRVAGS